MRLSAIFLISAVALAGCTHSPEDVRQTVEAFGMTDVHVGGYDFFNCGNDEDANFHTKFTATNAQGKRVRGVVCGGLLKGNTVRIVGAA